jgi:hypothetical protein
MEQERVVIMPVRANLGNVKRHRLGGLYDSMLDEAMVDAQRVDPRLSQAEYTPGLTDAQRQHLNATSPVTKARQSFLDKLSRGEPVDISAWQLGKEWDELPFIKDRTAKTIRVHSDDYVEVVEWR